MDKQVVKLTAEQGLTLKSLLEGGFSVSRILQIHSERWDDPCETLNDLDLETLATALIAGYEVEKTPEEKVLEYYNRVKDARASNTSYIDVELMGEMRGIRRTLDLLNIKIESINAKI